MKTAMPLTAAIALMALTACGDDATTAAKEPAVETAVTTPAAEPDAAPAKVATVDVAKPAPEIALKAPTPMPEPAEPIVAFESEDGALALGRGSLTMVSPVHDAASDVWSVFVQLDETAAADFYTLTSETTGEALAVVVDGNTVSTPVLQTAVYGGGFVFEVDDGAAASAVVAALKGETARPTIVEIAAEDALPADEADAQDTAATDAPDEDG